MNNYLTKSKILQDNNILNILMYNNAMEPFNMLCEYYGIDDDEATVIRSDTTSIPYIIHILEGIVFLSSIKASSKVVRSFILHPLLQNDRDINLNIYRYDFSKIDYMDLILVMEYRKLANSYLPKDVTEFTEPYLSPIPEVNLMLKADKLQNEKDFRLNIDSHGTSLERRERIPSLYQYFRDWFKVLKITDEDRNNFQELILNKFGWETYGK
jgi:hypothetical protein